MAVEDQGFFLRGDPIQIKFMEVKQGDESVQTSYLKNSPTSKATRMSNINRRIEKQRTENGYNPNNFQMDYGTPLLGKK